MIHIQYIHIVRTRIVTFDLAVFFIWITLEFCFFCCLWPLISAIESTDLIDDVEALCTY